MEFVQQSYLAWRDLMDNCSDPRVKNWFLMESPLPTILLIAAYVYFVKILGPKWMNGRNAFQIDKIIVVYNLLQVGLSSYLFYEMAVSAWIFGGYSFRCQPVDYSTSNEALRVASFCWLYLISKFTEFLDTIFFVLRKKQNQVTTLHVFHHSVMPFFSYIGTKFVPGGHGSFFGLLNTFVHIFMYSYYLLAGLGPKYQKFLWWKKYMTVLQVIQFAAIIVHSMQLLFIECNYPKIYVWLILCTTAIILGMFVDFYIKTYRTDVTNNSKKLN